MVLGSSWKVPSSVSRLSTSKGPIVATIVPPGSVAAIGGFPRIRQLGRTVTCVSGCTPTTVTYDRSMIVPNPGSDDGTGCPAGQPTARYTRPSDAVGSSSEASLEYAFANTLNWYTMIGEVDVIRYALDERHVPGEA